MIEHNIVRLTQAREWQEQKALFEWAEYMASRDPRLGLLLHIPNGELRHIIVAKRLKDMGVKRGFPDIQLPVVVQDCDDRPAYAGCFIELKRLASGTLSPEQRWWQDQLTRQGYDYAECHGWVEAARHLAWYLDRPGLAQRL